MSNSLPSPTLVAPFGATPTPDSTTPRSTALRHAGADGSDAATDLSVPDSGADRLGLRRDRLRRLLTWPNDQAPDLPAEPPGRPDLATQ